MGPTEKRARTAQGGAVGAEVVEGTDRMHVGRVLIDRLRSAGIAHIFGVPGDFNLGFLNEVLASGVRFIGTCNELNAAYAADAYARVRGLGCLVTTYAVGELSALNGVAGSYAEAVPVVALTGSPPTHHWQAGTLLHHTLGDYEIPRRIFEHITVDTLQLADPHIAGKRIDKVLDSCLELKRPVYISLCCDVVAMSTDSPEHPYKPPANRLSDPSALHEAVLEILHKLHEARRPLLIPGNEVRTRGLEDSFRRLLTKSDIPFATMMLGKSVIEEEHPQHVGLYCGDRSRPYVRDRVEKSDCLLLVGEKLTDFNTGGFSADIDRRSTVFIEYDRVKIGYHTFESVYIHDVLDALEARIIPTRTKETIHPAKDSCTHRRNREIQIKPDMALTMAHFFDRISSFIPEDSIVVAETGASLFNAAEVLMPKGVHFIGQTFYGSIGYSIGAALGAAIAAPHRPVILFVGDGSFQVTAQDVSTMIRNKCNITIFLLNNDGYTIERVICDDTYNDIQMWRYSDIPHTFGGTAGTTAKTQGELEAAIDGLDTSSSEVKFVEIILDRWDCNEGLRAAGKAMAAVNRIEKLT